MLFFPSSSAVLGAGSLALFHLITFVYPWVADFLGSNAVLMHLLLFALACRVAAASVIDAKLVEGTQLDIPFFSTLNVSRLSRLRQKVSRLSRRDSRLCHYIK